MKQLREATAETVIRIDNIESEARQLLSELDGLEVRLHRAFEAVSIDCFVAYLDVERKRMLEGERQAKINAGLASYPALGVSLLSLLSGQKSDLKMVALSVFRDEPFGDVRIAVNGDAVKVVNVSRMARERNITVARIVAYLEKEGNKVFDWQEFEARALKLRTAALRGNVAHLGIEQAALESIPALTAKHGSMDV